MVNEKEISIEAPWGVMRGIAWGNPSDPPVLAIPGRVHVCPAFEPLIKLLPACFYYVSIDLPGKYYDIAHPGRITRNIELDPVPAHMTWPTTREGLHAWYQDYYSAYEDHRYKRLHGPPETAPKYTYEQAEALLLKNQDMTKIAAKAVLLKTLIPVGNGLYRFSFDQRYKQIIVPPFSGEFLKKIFTSATTPTLAIYAQEEIDRKSFEHCDFLWDLAAWPNKNYRFKIVEGSHNVHIHFPQTVAEYVKEFLLEHFKAKL